MNHLMIDLETLGLQNDAAILSIGAVYFDIETGDLGDTVHVGILPENNNLYGRIDPNTVMFWLSQPEEARSRISKIAQDGVSLPVALAKLKNFCYGCSNPGKLQIWSNGANFDTVLLENAYRRYDIQPPWNYWQVRDVRTIVELGRALIGYDPKHENPFDGTEHDALADAIHQATYVSDIYRAMRAKIK